MARMELTEMTGGTMLVFLMIFNRLRCKWCETRLTKNEREVKKTKKLLLSDSTINH